MDAKQFLAEFGHIVNAPGGVQQLRELVLQFAVQGRLFAERQSRTLYLLSDVGKWGSGGTPLKTHADYYGGDIPWLVIGDLNDGIVTSASGSITQKGLENSSAKLIPPGALLVGMYGSIGKLGITGFECATNQAIAHCVVNEDLALTRYLFVFIRANRSHLFLQGKGLAQQNISQTILKAQKIELPPIEEQARIVAKVDELMALCDKLEAQQQKRRKLQTLTRTTALDALANAQSPHELKDAWLRVQSIFPLLFDGPEDINNLRNTIMNAAIRGYLTRRGDCDASELLAKCHTHREKLIKQKIIKKPKQYQELVDYPFTIPSNWVWAKFSEIGIFGRGKSKHRPRNDPKLFLDGKYPFIQTGDVARSVGKGITNYSKKYSEFGLEQSHIWPEETLCITIAANIADSAILKIKACFPDSVVGFIPFECVGNVEYFDLFVRTAKSSLLEYAPSTAQKNINLGILEQVAITLPPREEMEEIVTKTYQLMQLCDQLEKQLTKANKTAKTLAQAAIASITGNEIKEVEKVKIPKTELVSTLRLKVSPTNKDQAPLSAILAKHNGELSSKALWNYSGMDDIDKFYQQLKTEMARDWIVEPEKARMIEKDADNQSGAEAG
ncbi:restriction endonuclease subunit S [Methylobacter sp. BlB1]|uniref:restriction endonuclease subunit S n=1 Tax=Methylobacter sp. BlB1 TaxID=2785914 RepID=UPI001895AA3B|nr:restriction endonuclease subunit S [Methylobacter sp. BlB1]MBF6650190.1 restriction endonuclease subunit S [Methylobacter sp. BlB1]